MKKLIFSSVLIFLFSQVFTGFAQINGYENEVYIPKPETLMSQEDIEQLQGNPNVYEPFIVESNLTKPAGFGNGGGQRSALDSKGTDFWLMYISNYYGAPTLYFDITCEVNTNGTITIPGLAFSTPFSVTANTVTRVNLPSGAMVSSSGTIQSLGIHVVSNDEITVYGMNRIQYTTDGFLGLPLDILGNDYLIITYAGGTPEFGIVSPYDNNIVTITPKSGTNNGNPAGVPFNVTLDMGETYMVTAAGELTGSIVSSTLPVAVFGGNNCTNVPIGYCCCDHIVEHIPPLSTWGETFITRPLASRTNGDIWRFLSSEANTQLSINGVNVATLGFGDFYEINITASSFISATNPILAVQYSNSSAWDGVNSDPFMMILPPYQQFLGSYIFATPASGFSSNYFNSAVQTPGVPGMLMDGNPLNPVSYSPIGATGYSAAAFPANINTSHLISNSSGLPSGLYLYGFDAYDSYGYPGGQAFGAIASITSLTITPVAGTGVINVNNCWQAELLDQFGAPVPGVRVDFTITGPNSVNSGFAFTDANGIATYCYAGANTGQDIIVANVGSLNDTAQFNWTDSTAVPVSNWALYLGIFMAVAYVIVRFRKMI